MFESRFFLAVALPLVSVLIGCADPASTEEAGAPLFSAMSIASREHAREFVRRLQSEGIDARMEMVPEGLYEVSWDYPDVEFLKAGVCRSMLKRPPSSRSVVLFNDEMAGYFSDRLVEHGVPHSIFDYYGSPYVVWLNEDRSLVEKVFAEAFRNTLVTNDKDGYTVESLYGCPGYSAFDLPGQIILDTAEPGATAASEPLERYAKQNRFGAD